MILAGLLAAATPGNAVKAEHAFAADAQAIGQWASFRKWAAPDAVLFWPQPVNALDALRSLQEPAQAVAWRPARSFVSCDGATAANTGPTRWPNGKVGYFSTIWRRGEQGWRWAVDHGNFTAMLRWRWSAPTVVRRASCAGSPPSPDVVLYHRVKAADGYSADRTLRWTWVVQPDGARTFTVSIWTGRRYERVLDDLVAAPA